jgi:phage anti-repressor protein
MYNYLVHSPKFFRSFQQPYFFSQDPDYITVKERVANLCANGVEPEGVATIDIAVETLRVAEYLTPTLQEQLK